MSTSQKSITVLGGGIMGLMSAYILQKAGYEIMIYDPGGFPADNASFMAGGMLAPYSEIEHMDDCWIEAGLAGIKMWEDIRLDTGFFQKGSLLIAHPEDRYILERFKSYLPPDLQVQHDPKELEPALDIKFRSAQGGLFFEQEGHLSPEKTMNALCHSLRHNEKVKLVTGASFPADHPVSPVIDCRGADAQHSGLRGVKGEMLIVRNPEFSLSRPVRLMHPRYPLYIVPRENDVFMIGATVIEASESRNVSLRSSMELMSALYTLSPGFDEAEILEFKAGIRPAYPNNLPRIIIRDNVISCNGLFRHGYLLSPVIAVCVVDYLAGRENKFMSLFRRESDESYNKRAV